MDTLGEHQLLSFLDAVGLDDPYATQRLAQPAGHLGVDFAPLSEQRPQLLEHRGHDEPEQDHPNATFGSAFEKEIGQPPAYDNAEKTCHGSWGAEKPAQVGLIDA